MADNEDYNDEEQNEYNDEQQQNNDDEEQQQNEYQEEEQQNDDNNDNTNNDNNNDNNDDDNNNNNNNNDYEAPEEKQQPPQQPQQSYSAPVEKPASLKLAWDDLCKDNNTFNWFTAKHADSKLKKPDLVIDTNGKGGLNELAQYLKTKNDQILFALLRVNSYDDSNSVRAKFVFVKFIGSKVGFMSKAKLTPQLGKISEQFPVKHLSKDLDEGCHQFDPEHLSKDFLRFGGAHKPTRYEYGPNQAYHVKK